VLLRPRQGSDPGCKIAVELDWSNFRRLDNNTLPRAARKNQRPVCWCGMRLEFKADAQHAASTSQKSFNSPRANQSLEAMRQSVLSGAEGSLALGRDRGASHVDLAACVKLSPHQDRARAGTVTMQPTSTARDVPKNESKCFRLATLKLVPELDVLSPLGPPVSSGSVLRCGALKKAARIGLQIRQAGTGGNRTQHFLSMLAIGENPMEKWDRRRSSVRKCTSAPGNGFVIYQTQPPRINSSMSVNFANEFCLAVCHLRHSLGEKRSQSSGVHVCVPTVPHAHGAGASAFA